MTIRTCPSCQTTMREYQHTDTCPRCGKSIPKQEFSFFHGRTSRASLYPNHTSQTITISSGLFRLLIYIMVLIGVLIALGLAMDTPLMSVQGGGV